MPSGDVRRSTLADVVLRRLFSVWYLFTLRFSPLWSYSFYTRSLVERNRAQGGIGAPLAFSAPFRAVFSSGLPGEDNAIQDVLTPDPQHVAILLVCLAGERTGCRNGRNSDSLTDLLVITMRGAGNKKYSERCRQYVCPPCAGWVLLFWLRDDDARIPIHPQGTRSGRFFHPCVLLPLSSSFCN